MTTIPARLAQMSRTSSSPAQARQRAIQLYRDWYRSVRRFSLPHKSLSVDISHLFDKAPEIVSIYALDLSPNQVRHAIRQRFERHRYVTDPRVIDVLLLKERQEYQETMNTWKQTPHVLGLLLNNKPTPQKSFLQKFYEGLFRWSIFCHGVCLNQCV
jgi:NADH dehydrogenase (ubiquinone) 1 alpha subcomplex subunit 6